MQHIPHHSIEDIERSREEMAAFMNEKHVYPNLTLSGEDIHSAFGRTDPIHIKPWPDLSNEARQKYNDLARELNIELDARQSWTGPFEEDDKPITAIKCPSCGAMLTNLKGHPCL